MNLSYKAFFSKIIGSQVAAQAPYRSSSAQPSGDWRSPSEALAPLSSPPPRLGASSALGRLSSELATVRQPFPQLSPTQAHLRSLGATTTTGRFFFGVTHTPKASTPSPLQARELARSTPYLARARAKRPILSLSLALSPLLDLRA